MSLRIAVALAATIGAGILGVTQAEARPDVVGFRGDYSPGTIVIKTNERRLYLVVGQGQAMRYPVGVGRAGKQWAGTTQIDGKYLHPAWSPPSEVRRDKPFMPAGMPRMNLKSSADLRLFVCAQKSEAMPLFSQSP